MPKNVAVGVGLMEFPFSGAAAYWRWVDLCEAGGVNSIWQTDRLVSREPFLECMSVMAALAGRTRRIKFGVNVLSLAMRDAVLVARQCATIDFLSNGRLLPAFGIGSPLGPEWTTLNLDTKTRGRKTDEGLEVIRRLWCEDKVDFEGVHYHLSGASICAKAGAARPADVDRRLVRGGDPAHRAARHRLAGRAAKPRSRPATWSPRSSAAAIAEGRPIDDDHYGAGIPFRFGRADDPALGAAVRGLPQAHRPRPRGIISRSATPRRSSSASPPTSRPASRNSSCARRRKRRRRDHGADPPADRRGAAARRRPLAKAGEARRMNGRASCRASGPASSTPTARCSISPRRRPAAPDELGDVADRLTALWRDKQLQYTWLRAVQGRHADFWQVTGDALDFALETLGLARPALRERLMQLYLTLDPFPEARRCCCSCARPDSRRRSCRTARPRCSPPRSTSAGLGPFLDQVLSVEEVGVYKPHPLVYRLACDRLGVAADGSSFVSSNAWDAWAASAFGMQAVWCNRYGQRRERLPGEPDREIRSLAELPALLARPAG